MFEHAVKVFNLFGFNVRVDPSWILIGLLITWSLATGIFPQWYPEIDSPGTYWLMGAGGAVGLFFSIVWHEFCHSIVARWYGLPISGITLFIFGGVAEMNEEPQTPKSEFLMALAGPLSSLILGVFLLLVSQLAARFPDAEAAFGAVIYMGYINIALAVFNMIPGFPLDGGRLLRAALWGWKNNMRWATKLASRIGGGVGMMFIFLGVLSIVGGAVIGGIWYCLIGLFLRNAASNSYKQLLLRQALGGEQVARFMTENPVAVRSEISLDEFIDLYVYRYHHKLFPVVDDNDRLVGYITTRKLKEIPSTDWQQMTVGDIMLQLSSESTIRAEQDAMEALSRMNSSANSRLLVVDNDQLVGIITLKDLLDFFSLKVELEEQEVPIGKTDGERED